MKSLSIYKKNLLFLIYTYTYIHKWIYLKGNISSRREIVTYTLLCLSFYERRKLHLYTKYTTKVSAVESFIKENSKITHIQNILLYKNTVTAGQIRRVSTIENGFVTHWCDRLWTRTASTLHIAFAYPNIMLMNGKILFSSYH